MLLGQADKPALGRALYRAGPRSNRSPPGSQTASNSALRILRHADCFFLSPLAAQAKEIQRPGDSGLRDDLRNAAVSDRVRARRSPWRHFRPHHSDRALNITNDRHCCWRRRFDYLRDPLAARERIATERESRLVACPCLSAVVVSTGSCSDRVADLAPY